MARDVSEGGMRGSGLLLGWGLGLGGTALLGLAAITIYDFADAVARRAPIIMWDEGGWIALPVGLALLAIASALFIGRHHGADIEGHRRDVIRRLLVLSACLLPFAIAFPFSAYWLAGQHLEGRGYKECLDGLWIAVGRVPDVSETPAPCRGLSGNLADHVSRTGR